MRRHPLEAATEFVIKSVDGGSLLNIRTLIESFEIPWIHPIQILYNYEPIYTSPPKPSNKLGAAEKIFTWGDEDYLMLTGASETYISSQTSSLGIVFLITGIILSAVGTALFFAIVQSRQLNKILNETNHRFMAIYLHVGAPIIILSNESIHDANPAALNVLGGTLEEFKGRSIYSFLLIDEKFTEEKLFDYRQKLRMESFVKFECQIKHGNGQVLDVELTLTKGKSSSINHSYVLINDLTEKKKQDAIIAREHDMITDNTRLKSLATMAGGIAHEINNPLAIISGIAQQLQRKIQHKVSLTELDQDACKKITRNTERITNIIGKLQSLTPQAPQLQFIDYSVDSFLDDMNLIYSRKCVEKNIIWKIVNYCHGEQIHCSPPQIEQILGVLIENSIDSVQRFQDDRRYVNLITQLKGNEIEFSVVDGGPKLSDEVVKNLMAPFFTTKEQGSGTGLNLSIAFALAKSHKGNLFYDKSATTVRFCFTIPKLVSRQNRRAS